jgi:4-aminobutyrate aminotransferase/(S)-3-amino-2-methylpropionate transaminase
MEKLNFRTIPGPKSAEIINISNQCEPRCAADQTPIVWDHGDGVWVWDVDGNPYIDFTSGVLVSNLGHNHPGLVSAIQKQAPRMMNCYSFPTPERVSASSRLVKVLPDNIDRVFMLSTGADATEAALRIARRYSGKQEILAFYGGFHGRTYGAMGVAGSISTRRGFGMPVPGGIMAPYAYCYRCFYGKTYPECGMFCLKALDRIIDSTSSGDLGAVIVEPYQGTAGFVFPPEGWIKALENWARQRNLLFIVDEVQASFGRTGKMFAIEWEDIHPHLLCLGKGMGSGIPASAVCGESTVFECMKPGELSSTWGGNPLASAAVLAVLDAMEKQKLPENSCKMGEYLKSRFLDMKSHYPFIGDVRGKGLVIGIEFVEPVDRFTPSPDITRKVVQGCAEHGVLLGKLGLYGNVIRIAPPLIITQAEIDVALDVFDNVFQEIK